MVAVQSAGSNIVSGALSFEASALNTAGVETPTSGLASTTDSAGRATDEMSSPMPRAMSGRLARGIPNRAQRLLAELGPLPFPAQNFFYALQWWVFGAFAVVVYLRWLWLESRRERAETDAPAPL